MLCLAICESLHCLDNQKTKIEIQTESGKPGERDEPMTPGHEGESNPWDSPNAQHFPASCSLFSCGQKNLNVVSGYLAGRPANKKLKKSSTAKSFGRVSTGEDNDSLCEREFDKEFNSVASCPGEESPTL